MIRNFLKTAWRNLRRNRATSVINILGLSIGMAVALLIGLWIWDELNYDRYHKNYDRIAQVMQHQTFNGSIGTQSSNPGVMAGEIKRVHGDDFKYVIQSSWNNEHVLKYGDKLILKSGSFIEPEVSKLFSLKILKGDGNGLKDINSMLISASVAEAVFGKKDPLGQVIRVDDNADLKVVAVYEDLPDNTSLRDVKLIMPWELYLKQNPWIGTMTNPWGSNFSQTFAMLADHSDMAKVSTKIKDVKLNQVPKEQARYNPQVFLHPMSKWRLHSNFKNGINEGGLIENVWLFGIIGIFVLVLACINFMNLSTARSEKRAREVGVRKAIGSMRRQLIFQFFTESVMVALFSLVLSIGLVLLMLPAFNTIAVKNIRLPWNSGFFWLLCLGFSLLTGFVAGLYPALYLSSFQPVKVLKGTFRAGRFAAIPRKVLVVAQFTISIVLIIGTVVVYQQIRMGEDRPIGYDRDGLVSHSLTSRMYNHYETMRSELKGSGAITEMTLSGSPITDVWNTNGGFEWEGKDPSMAVDFPNNAVSHEYGETVRWKIREGRDFSRKLASDSTAFILNQSAVDFIGLKDPVGKTIRWDNRPFTIIGVVEDLLVQSPYKPVRPAMFHIASYQNGLLIFRLNPKLSAKSALAKLEATLKKTDPESPFNAAFVDEAFAEKFGNEKRIGKLAGFFATLAIFISCLGLFGLASFIAEQRVKEIGIRKVLGASVPNLWALLSKDFVFLVILSCLISIPLAWYYMDKWLQNYDYRTAVSWWIFGIAAAGALIITLITVSYQAVKAAMANPIRNLRSE